MFGLFNYESSETVYLRHFYHESFMGDRVHEEVREAKVKKVIKAMGDKWLLAKPINRLTEEK